MARKEDSEELLSVIHQFDEFARSVFAEKLKGGRSFDPIRPAPWHDVLMEIIEKYSAESLSTDPRHYLKGWELEFWDLGVAFEGEGDVKLDPAELWQPMLRIELKLRYEEPLTADEDELRADVLSRLYPG